MKRPWDYMSSPSRSPLPPPSPPAPSRSSQSTRSERLSHASNLGWWSVSPLIVYMFWCCSLETSHPRLFQFEELFISIWITPFAFFVEQIWWWQTPIFVYFRKIFISPIFEEQFCHLQYTYFVVIFLSILWLFHFLLVCKIFAENNVYILLVAFLNLWWVILLMLL